MTDVYIAYAREDRERVRPLAESLQFEGWDVWWDPSEPTIDGSAAVDQKLGTAGAIVVVWSAYSRASEYVRSEAATGLYKNKLIQTRIDEMAPPRPFDQLDVMDIGLWSGERDDPNWRKTLSAIRLFAGPPGTTLPEPVKKKKKQKAHSGPSYLEASRSIAPGPVVVFGLMLASAASFWFLDPLHLRTPAPVDAGEAAEAVYKPASGPAETAPDETTLSVFEDSAEAEANWLRVDREEPMGLRDYIAAWPKSSNAETARSLLRVMDAQAWVEAVTADNESAYARYLKEFPKTGAMAAAAQERLASLGVERTQAIEEIQRGLTALKLYQSAIDGKVGQETTVAVRAFAVSKQRSAPTLATAAPRDLRNFADMIARAVAAAGGTIATTEPIIAAATTTTTTTATAPAMRPATTTAAVTAAADADRQRIAQAQAAAEQAERIGADTLAAAELQRTAEANAWAAAERAGTMASYQSYLASYPAGAQATAARAAVTRLSRPAAYSLDQISSSVRVTVEAARRAQTMANARAASARQTADGVASAPGIRNIVAADGDRYETQISSGAPNGLGLRVSGDAGSAGDRYRGELRNGLSVGLGVYEFADNPNNAKAGALRYEGEHAGDAASGFGVTYWKNGDNFAGQEVGAPGTARGVLTFANGQRYEGEVRNGVRHGVGVVWGPDGQVLMAGRWENGQLVEPATTEPIALVPSGPAATPAP